MFYHNRKGCFDILIKFVNKDRFEKIYKHFAIYSNDKFLISRTYSKGYSKNYIRDLKKAFMPLITGILGLLFFPVGIIYTLYSFIPRLIINKDYKKQLKEGEANRD